MNDTKLPTRLTLEPDNHSVTDETGRLILHREHGFDGADLPTIAEMVRNYNSHPAAVALARALNDCLVWRHNHVASAPESQAREEALLNAAQEWEKASKP